MMTEAEKIDTECLDEEHAHGNSGGGLPQSRLRAPGRTPPELEERLGRFLESLRHLDAATGPPSPAAGSACGSGCGASTVSLSPSDSVSCCCRPSFSVGGGLIAGHPALTEADAAAGGYHGGIGADTQSAADHALARQLRKLQLQGKAALSDARGVNPAAAAHQAATAATGRLVVAPPPPAGETAACDALLRCSPSSAASCSGPTGGAVCAAQDSLQGLEDDGAVSDGELQPTTLRFGAAAADAPPRNAAPDGGARPPPAAPCRRGVFVGNLPGAVTERALMALFSRQNLPVDCLWIARDHRRSLGYGYVVFSRSDPLAHIRAARTLDGASLDRQPVRVRPSDRDFDAFPLHGGASSSGGGSSSSGAKAGQLGGSASAGGVLLHPTRVAAGSTGARMRSKQPLPGALRPLNSAVAAVAAAAAAAGRRAEPTL